MLSYDVVILKNAMKKSHTVQQGSHRRINDRGERREQPKGAETRPGDRSGRRQRGRRRERERKKERKRKRLKVSSSTGAQEVLLVAAAEDCPVRTLRAGQYRCLNTNICYNKK